LPDGHFIPVWRTHSPGFAHHSGRHPALPPCL